MPLTLRPEDERQSISDGFKANTGFSGMKKALGMDNTDSMSEAIKQRKAEKNVNLSDASNLD